MAVNLNPRAERLLARLPKLNVFSLLELLLLLLIAMQCARLFWGALTPIGPVGDWKALDQMQSAAPAVPTIAATFDPFFRQAVGAPGAAPATVTSLDIRLYGISGNQATGGGSAIIGTTNGEQRSVVVGEEIMPGVTLVGIAFDHVIIGRNGTTEQLYLDQTPATPAGQAPVMPPPQVQQPVVPVPTVVTPPAPPQPPQNAQRPRSNP